MVPIKGIQIQITPNEWGIGFGLFFYGDNPTIFHICIGPVSLTINKPLYFENGILDFEVFR